MVLRGLVKGESAGKAHKATLNECTVGTSWPSFGAFYSCGITVGAKDYSDYTPSVWREATTDEINGHMPQGGNLHRVLTDAGGNTLKVLSKAASMQAAHLRDWQSSDQDVYDPIYVRTAASSPQSVSYTGSPSISDSGGVKTYTFPGGSYTASKLQVIDAAQWEDYGNAQGATTVIKRGVSLGTSVYRPANPTRVSSVYGIYTGQSTVTLHTGEHITISPSNSNLYDCTTWEYYWKNPTYDYVGYFASSGAAGGGGSVTVTPYTPETVEKKVFQQAVMTPEETTDQKWGYFTRVPGGGTENTKTFLVQSGSNAIQNFAFDGMEDV